MKLAINGFGRIGRAVFKIALKEGIDIEAINDLHGAEETSYLLKYDSVYGKYSEKVEVVNGDLVVNGKRIRMFKETNPAKLPWKKMGIDVVVESTGVFRDREGANLHLKAGAKRVIITSPAKGQDITIAPGVNQEKLNAKHKIISVASCTTNCLAPVMKILNDNYIVKEAIMNTIHAYTSSQNLLDGSNKRLRRGRAAGLNIVPSSTGASEAVAEVIPELKGKITGMALRVPVACGSILDVVVRLKKDFNVKKINESFRKASLNEMRGIVEYTEEEIVSSDVIGNSSSAVIDGLSTQVSGELLRVVAWYDNEYGYSNRVVDVIKILKRFG